MIKIYIIFSLYFYLFVTINSQPSKIQQQFFVDSTTSSIWSTESCGSFSNPCDSIQDAISSINSQKTDGIKYIIELANNVYDGLKNRELFLGYFDDLIIRTSASSYPSIIDCENISFSFNILNSNVEFKNIIFTNCIGLNGGAINAVSSSLKFENTGFYFNTAENGGAMYVKDSTVSFIDSSLQSNNASRDGGAIYSVNSNLKFTKATLNCNIPINSYSFYDIYQSDSKSFFSKSDISGARILCGSDSESNSLGDVNAISPKSITNLCSPLRSVICKEAITQFPLLVEARKAIDLSSTVNIPKTQTCNRNGRCDPKETCLTCPSDCPSCTFTGVAFSLYRTLDCPTTDGIVQSKSSCLYSGYPTKLNSLDIPNLYTNVQSHGNLSTYFTVSGGSYSLNIQGSNIGVDVFIDHLRVINSNFIQSSVSLTYPVTLSSDFVHSLIVSISTPGSTGIKSSLNINLVDDTTSDIIKPFFSQNVCGDGIIDLNEECDVDSQGINGIGKSYPRCGDSICNEVPESCLRDCVDVIGTHCGAQTSPITNDIPVTDTTSFLLNRQYMNSLPGLNHFSHGLDLFTGEELPTMIFDLGYCDSFTHSVIQDTYRGRFYNIPPEFYSESLPICSYDTKTETFNSEYEYTSSQKNSNSWSVSAKLTVKTPIDWGGTASFGMSKSKESETIKSLQRERTGQIGSTKVKCLTSTVSRNSARFHRNFVRDISLIDNVLDMSYFIEKYGAFYYDSAALGGTLETLFFMSGDKDTDQNQETLKTNMEISASGSMTTPYGGGGGGYSGQWGSDSDRQQQQEFEKKVEKSSVIAKGGPLGSFGPDHQSASSYGEWASQVDLRPVPIDPQLRLVADIIPDSWTYTISNSTCLIKYQLIENCSIGNATVPEDCFNMCQITANDPCLNFTNCYKYDVWEEKYSVKDLWVQGYNYYLNKTGGIPTKRYEVKLHFFFHQDLEFSTLDTEMLSNLTITITSTNSLNDEQTYSKSGISIPIGCTSKNETTFNGCQYPLYLGRIIFSRPEIEAQNLTIYANIKDKVTNEITSVLLDSKKYFSDIVLQITNPTYNRGFMFNLSDGFYTVSNQSIISAPLDSAPKSGQYTNSTSDCKWQIEIREINITDPLNPNVTIPQKYAENITDCVHRVYFQMNSYQTFYPKGFHLFFSTTNLAPSNTDDFFAIIAGDLGTHSQQLKRPKLYIGTSKYRENFDATVGNIHTFLFSFPGSAPILSTSNDDVFLMWTCPNDVNHPFYALCTQNADPSFIERGFINLSIGSFFTQLRKRTVQYTLN